MTEERAIRLHAHDDSSIPKLMHGLLNAHVRRCHKRYRNSGHVWQGRFKAFPIPEDHHLSTVRCRQKSRFPWRRGAIATKNDL